MRLFLTALTVLGLAAPAVAQSEGSFTIDAMTTPGRHFGFGYYVTDGLSLRPTLGAGYSAQYGTTLNLGLDVRYEVLAGRRVSPYLTATFNYLHQPGVTQYDQGIAIPYATTPDVTRYGGGAGIRARIKYRISVVAEGLVMNSALTTLPASSAYGPQQYAVTNGTHFEAALGVSYAFN
jgi:hypothetical protein